MTEETWSEICDAPAPHMDRPPLYHLMVSCAWVGAHLVVTVVIDTFAETEETRGWTVVARREEFRQHWKSFDPKGKRVLKTRTVIDHPTALRVVWDRVTTMALLPKSSVRGTTVRFPHPFWRP